jgi:hypothetical protein
LAKEKLSEEALEKIRGYTSWLPFNPELNSVARLYLNHGLAGAVCSLSPAPFCCSRVLYREWKSPIMKRVGVKVKSTSANDRRRRREGVEEDQEMDGDDAESFIVFENKDQEAELMKDLKRLDEQKLEEAIRMHKIVYVDKHAFLHRLYVGLDTHFGNRSTLHDLLADFLPETKAAMTQPTMGRARELAEARQASLQRSLQAAENAQALGMPQFHWAAVYRL